MSEKLDKRAEIIKRYYATIKKLFRKQEEETKNLKAPKFDLDALLSAEATKR